MLTKKPETITWIDRFSAGSIFLDIGQMLGHSPFMLGK